MSKTIEAFTKAKTELITEFFAAVKTLNDLKNTLKEHGVKIPKKMPSSSPSASAKPTAKKKAGKRTHGKWDEEAVLKFIGDKELSFKEISKNVKVGMQTVTKKIKESKKFQWRNKDEKNTRSPLLAKAK